MEVQELAHREGPLERYLREEIRKLNLHLPKGRKSLSMLLEEKEPSVESVDGKPLPIERSELVELERIVPPEMQSRLMLPIVIMRRTDLGRGAFEVFGGSAEHFVVRKILGLEESGERKAEGGGGLTLIYRPQVQELRRRFRTVTAVGFSVPKDEEVSFSEPGF